MINVKRGGKSYVKCGEQGHMLNVGRSLYQILNE